MLLRIIVALFSVAAISPVASLATPLDPIYAMTDAALLKTGAASFDVGDEKVQYNAATDRLSYFFSGRTELTDRRFDPSARFLEFNSIFAWSAGVDESGLVTDHGAVIWLGDLGHGYETLAVGSVLDIGFGFYPNDEVPTLFQRLQALFQFTFVDDRIKSIRSTVVQSIEWEFATFDDTPFFSDFSCTRQCAYSDGGLNGVAVGEPTPWRLTLLALVVLGVAAALRVKPKENTIHAAGRNSSRPNNASPAMSINEPDHGRCTQ